MVVNEFIMQKHELENPAGATVNFFSLKLSTYVQFTIHNSQANADDFQIRSKSPTKNHHQPRCAHEPTFPSALSLTGATSSVPELKTECFSSAAADADEFSWIWKLY